MKEQQARRIKVGDILFYKVDDMGKKRKIKVKVRCFWRDTLRVFAVPVEKDEIIEVSAPYTEFKTIN